MSRGAVGKEAKIKEAERRSYVCPGCLEKREAVEFRVRGCNNFSQTISGFYTFLNLQNDTNNQGPHTVS